MTKTKKVFETVLSFGVFLFGICASAFSQGGVLVVVDYGVYQVDGKAYPIQLVYTPNDGYVKLRIRFDHEKWSKDSALEFLKGEVVKLASAGRTSIGNGYFFTFTGEFPVWKPYRQYTGTGGISFQYLQFAEEGKVVGKEITARGLDKPTGGNNPYPKIK